MAAFPNLLLVRGSDLFLAGVQWSGFSLQAGHETGVAQLRATGSPAVVTLTFPPQSIAEEKGDGAAGGQRGASLAGPSRVQFSFPLGSTINLNAEGLLRALTEESTQILPGAADEPGGTSLELPWHLQVSLQAITSGLSTTVEHTAAPSLSPSGTQGLWTSRLHAQGSTRQYANLQMQALRAQGDLPLHFEPLSAGQRQTLVDLGSHASAMVRRLELSALGGSLDAELQLPEFSWQQAITLGRDRHVRVEATGILFPFGHRAAFVQTADRAFVPPWDPGAPSSAQAGLQRQTSLVVLEPVRGPARDDQALARQFPFDEVEILAPKFSDLAPPAWQTYTPPPGNPSALQTQLDTLLAEREALRVALQSTLDAQPASLELYLQADLGSVSSYRDAKETAGNAAANLQALKKQQADIDRQLQYMDPATQEYQDLLSMRPTNQAISQAADESRAAQAQADRLLQQVTQEFNGLPRTFDDLERLGDQNASRYRVMAGDIAAVQAEIADVTGPQIPRPFFFTPERIPGEPLRVPMRFGGNRSDVFITVPVLFVVDTAREATRSRTSPALAESAPSGSDLTQRLSAAWATYNRIPVPPTLIDLIRSAAPSSADLHDVRELALQAVEDAGTYRTVLQDATVELASLRSLLPGTAAQMVLTYSAEYLKVGEAAQIALQAVPGSEVLMDFLQHPDRAGGLLAPRFQVDAISRELGPVAQAALGAAGLPDLSAVYQDATLFGFPLASLIDAAAAEVPLAPKIEPVLQDGRPCGARMQWSGLRLQSHAPFEVRGDASQLAVEVETSTSNPHTTCTVSNFDLILPPGGNGLLRLGFTAVTFRQLPDKPPDVKVDGLELEFLGSLALIRELAAQLAPFASMLPEIHITSSEVMAAYSLSIADVAAGPFQLRGIAVYLGVTVPLEKKPVTIALRFASRTHPFNLSVLLFGGGGYFEIEVGGDGLTRLELSLEFGASIAVDFVIASGEAHALGGVYFLKEASGELVLGGYLRIGGSLNILGLVSVSIELMLSLRYESDGDQLVGRASLVIEIHLLFFSKSVTIDSGVWRLAGSRHTSEAHRLRGLRSSTPTALDYAQWVSYREAFASV